MQQFIINRNDSGQRLDKFITKTFKTMPQSLMYKYIRTKKIKVNRKRADIKYVLCEGDTVECFIKEEFFNAKENADNSFISLKPHLDIIYEDENILLVDKKIGMIVHSDDKESANTLIENIKAYLYHKGEYKPEDELSFTPALCNRIDRNTGGIVIAAKNAEALRIMNEKIKNDEISKYYLCIVHGKMPKKEDSLSAYLIKNQKDNTVKVYDRPDLKNKNSKKIITKYKVIEESKELSLLEIHLITGRTHQIRAHMAYIGHPLLGDGKYGINKEDRKAGFKSQALYSYSVRFDFKGESGILTNLSGKQFFVNKKNIPFLSEIK